MPAAPGSVASAKPVKFARPYYFDVVTVPRNEKLETSVEADGLQEFISKVRSRNVILASKEISGEQLQSILRGKQTWCDRGKLILKFGKFYKLFFSSSMQRDPNTFLSDAARFPPEERGAVRRESSAVFNARGEAADDSELGRRSR